MPIADDVKLGLANRFLVTVIPSNRSLGSWAKAEGLDVSWEVLPWLGAYGTVMVAQRLGSPASGTREQAEPS